MQIEDFFTEYDDTITGESFIDPLGMTVIWAAYGQKIFRNRISSISNDVRSYTLNLFNHYIIRKLLAETAVVRAQAEAISTLGFKQSCLIHLENIFVYSVIQNRDENWISDVISEGVLGISKASRKWHQSVGNTELVFGHGANHQILVRQLLLGVSGRYKTPMLEMKYFDRAYCYQPLGQEPNLWLGVETFVAGTPCLKRLEDLLLPYLCELLASGQRAPVRRFDAIPWELKAAIVNAFRSPSFVGAYSRDYWLEATGLRQGIAGAMLDVLDQHAASDAPSLSDKAVFEAARIRLLQGDGTDADITLPIKNIQAVEPFLANLDLLFTLILCRQHNSIEEIERDWCGYGRDVHTLPEQARQLQDDKSLLAPLNRTGRTRMQRLLNMGECGNFTAQIKSLYDYHCSVMQARGQVGWLGIDSGGKITVLVGRTAPAVDQRPLGGWVHRYYVPQFAHFARGLLGRFNEAA